MASYYMNLKADFIISEIASYHGRTVQFQRLSRHAHELGAAAGAVSWNRTSVRAA